MQHRDWVNRRCAARRPPDRNQSRGGHQHDGAKQRPNVDPRHSICELSATDKLTLTRVVAKNGMFARAFNQIEAVTKACAQHLLGGR